jgi:hypothetical protein
MTVKVADKKDIPSVPADLPAPGAFSSKMRFQPAAICAPIRKPLSWPRVPPRNPANTPALKTRAEAAVSRGQF